jgi:hypothetical protein
MGAFDYFEEEWIPVLQSGSIGGNSILPYTFSFNEPRNAFKCFFDFNPEWIASYEDKVVTFVSGNLYVHDNTTNYNTFYGTRYDPTIELVFNGKEAVKKTFNAFAYQSNQIWISDINGDILTSMINPQTGFQQISQLKAVDYEIQDNIRYAALLRDANSMQNAAVALLEGDYLDGQWMKFKLKYKGSSFAWLFAPYLTDQPLSRNF